MGIGRAAGASRVSWLVGRCSLTMAAVDFCAMGQRGELGGGGEHLLRRALEKAAAAAHEERVACEERAVLFAAARDEVRGVAIRVGRRVHALHLEAAERQDLPVFDLAGHRLHVLAADDLRVGHELLELLVASGVIKVVVGGQDKLDHGADVLSCLERLLRLHGVHDGRLLGYIVDDQIHVVVGQRIERRDAEAGGHGRKVVFLSQQQSVPLWCAECRRRRRTSRQRAARKRPSQWARPRTWSAASSGAAFRRL